MGICIDNKSHLNENHVYLLPSVKDKLLITLCLEIPCKHEFGFIILPVTVLRILKNGYEKSTKIYLIGIIGPVKAVKTILKVILSLFTVLTIL